MSPVVKIVEGRSRREIDVDDEPVRIGGRGCDLVIEQAPDADPVALLGSADGAVFIQPVVGAALPVHCNGVVLTASRWLDDGDVLMVGSTRLSVRTRAGSIEITAETTRGSSPSRTTVPIPLPEAAPRTIVDPVAFTPRIGKVERRQRLRPGVGILWAAVVLVAVAAFVLISGRFIDVEIRPVPERVEIVDGWPVVPVGERFFALPGRYRVTAELTNHRPLDREIAVASDGPTVFEFAMAPLPGRVRVTTGDVAGASILVNGESVAQSPAVLELDMGEHALVIRDRRHAEAARRLAITEPGQELELDIVLEPSWGTVHITTSPPSARVVVDGVDAGATPLTTELGAGSHTVDIELAGYAPYRTTVSVEAGGEHRLERITLERPAGRLRLASDPEEASVRVDDAFAGVTPLVIDLAPGREHEITLAKAGYRSHTDTILLEPGRERHLAITLEALRGVVRFESTPPGAELFIDGEARGRTGTTLELAERPTRVEMRLDGCVPFATTITPRAGVVGRVEGVLEPADPVARLARTVTTSQEAVLVLIEGGRFTTGASRRVPGRRANETVLTAEITRPYYLAAREVSNREYRAFAEQHRSGGLGGVNLEIDHHPVVRVSWNDAARYCNWLSAREGLPQVYREQSGRMVAVEPLPAGYRLPTEAEWVWAARYDSAGSESKYGWGNTLPIPAGAGNYGDRSADAVLGDSLPGYDDGYPGTAPVGSFAANPRGLFNLGGNVSEWLHDRYTMYPPGTPVLVDPEGPTEGEYHVIRGASWMDDTVTELRLSYRDYGDEPRPDVGFRVARTAR